MSWTGGDWLCGACQHENFKKRKICQKCGYPKFGGVDVSTYLYNRKWCIELWEPQLRKPHKLLSIWNDQSRLCESVLRSSMVAYGNEAGACPPGWKTGDWVCPTVGCGVHNYASKAEGFKCGV